jgi:hypothetical protein
MDKKARERQLIQEQAEGIEAKKLVNNKVWKEAVETLEASLIDAIRSGNWFQKKAREENCRRLQVLDDLKTVINNKLEMGEQARKRLEANNANK